MSSDDVSPKGYLIAIEGLDGSGKTTIAKRLVELLTARGYRAIYTCEPYSDAFIGILNSIGRKMGALFEALIMAADRYYHLKEVIEPAVNAGVIVVTDRYYYSSLAYQGAKGADLAWVRELNKFAINPNIAIYLDIDPETGLKRKAGKPSRVEYLQENLRILERARQIYISMVESGELLYVDASSSIDEVLKKCIKLLCVKLGILCIGT